MFFVMSGLAYCLGFLAPWASVSWFGFSMSFNGGSGLELFAVVAAIAAVGLGVWESVLSERGKITLLRILLCAGCFAFAVGEGVYFGFLTHIMQFGFGLALMILAGGICLYIAINDAPPSVGRNLLPLSIAAIVCAGGFAAYKGHAARESTNFANIFNGFGGAGSMDDVTADLTPKTRDDVTIQLNSTREVWVLEPESQWDGNRTPAPGKAFLVCNVTVAYKGTSGELGVYGTAIRMQGSDKKVYDDYTFLENAKTINKLSATLLPGGTAMGDVVFEVTPGTKPDKLEFLANPPMF